MSTPGMETNLQRMGQLAKFGRKFVHDIPDRKARHLYSGSHTSVPQVGVVGGQIGVADEPAGGGADEIGEGRSPVA